MPGTTTPDGLPYAEPTDPLVQWPATSQALAERIAEIAVISGANHLTLTWAGTIPYPILKLDVDRTPVCGIVTDGGTKPIVLKFNESTLKLEVWLDGVLWGNLVKE